MVDTGAALTVLLDAWCKALNIPIDTRSRPRVRAADDKDLPILGTASFTARLSPSLELELAKVAVQKCASY